MAELPNQVSLHPQQRCVGCTFATLAQAVQIPIQIPIDELENCSPCAELRQAAASLQACHVQVLLKGKIHETSNPLPTSQVLKG